MSENNEKLFEQVRTYNKYRHHLRQIITAFSLVVVFLVFWSLKLTGIGIAGEAFCGMQEHIHSDECLQTALICTLEEVEPHNHSESCLHKELICTLEETEPHSHSESCLRKELICETEESDEHSHEDACWAIAASFGCGLSEAEGHIHTAQCITEQTQLDCEKEAGEGHLHDGACWAIAASFGCGLSEAEGHIHTAQCITEQTQLDCGITATEGHLHTDSCYEIAGDCPLEEHTHIESCYSDVNADLETEEDWEKALADMAQGPTLRENLVLVAKSQLGYRESELNFQVDAGGVRRGITRYGQWYGSPYGDWSAMFVSFCLNYAGAEEIPMSAGSEALRLEYAQAERYTPAAEGAPEIGNLIFLQHKQAEAEDAAFYAEDLSPAANAVAIIIGFDETTLTVIEGDVDNTVIQITYSLNDPTIMGYGIIPEAELEVILPEETTPEETTPEETTPEETTPEETSPEETTPEESTPEETTPEETTPEETTPEETSPEETTPEETTPEETTPEETTPEESTPEETTPEESTPEETTPEETTPEETTPEETTPEETTPEETTPEETTPEETVPQETESAETKPQETEPAQPKPPLMMAAKPDMAPAPAATEYTIWLDGTNGGLGYLTGSPNTAYTAKEGSTLQLPETWTSPSKYSYKLRGWYDVTNSCYYPAGGEMVVTGNAVLYADWVANTYNLGVFNAHVADTVSTNSFITTYMFDYNYLFNVQSSNPQVTVSKNSHSETWSMVTSGGVNYNGQTTFNFVFTDNDGEGSLNIPNNRSDRNRYHDATTVTSGIYSSQLGELLFSPYNAFDPQTGTGVLGKTYLGTGDHLLQIMDDPSDEHYGYYYYDSKRNAASYNQSNGRFYVYDYLAATSDSIGGAYSDFIPLNSPYANTNGKNIGTYNYAGVNGEYSGIPHFRYDSKYNSGDYNSTSNVSTDYAYGMRMDIKFYLPNDPGSGGNKDMYGNDMQFQFSGDDDLWVLIDGVVALDIGGIHQIVGGTIDFSTGEVVVNGSRKTSLMDLGITAGDHTMTVLYLERGSSMSNCAIYFNMAPRFGLELQKEDILTQEILNGAKFTVYEDFACTKPAELWFSEEAYNQDLADGTLNQSQSTFTIQNGVAKLWGLGSGNTYYIKETGPPDKEGYGTPNGVIRVTIEREGQATYLVDVIADAEGNEPSTGFTVHGVRIDESTQTVYIIATNAPENVTETTTAQVIKKWEDTADHSDDYIQAYLTVTDANGTVRRIREVTLSDENDWMYIWTNLPKYDYDTLEEVHYGIEESYESGYYSTVRRITEIEISQTQWAESLTFQNGQTYILRSSSGYLSTIDNRADTGYKWVDEQTAKSSPNALWTVTVSGGKVKFTNGVKQTITLYYNGGSTTDFYARVDAPQNADRQEFSYNSRSGGLQIFYQQGNNKYYLTKNMNSSGKFSVSTGQSNALILNPVCRISQSDIQDVEDWAYQITNTPLPVNNETSLSVKKEWSIPAGYNSNLYQEFTVTVQLLANGVNTGRSITLNLKNNWQGSFLGLPYKDDNGEVIHYSVAENWKKTMWTTHYGEIVANNGSPPTYSTVITNTYYPGGPELPSTGSAGRLIYILCGSGIILGALVYGIGSRRKRERRMK